MSAPSWQGTARLYGFPVETLSKAQWEILSALDRVLCRSEGWAGGLRDKRASTRRWIEFKPERLALHGCRLHPCTYRRALRSLERLGLVRSIRGPGKRALISPSWWRHPEDGVTDPALPARIWTQAAARMLTPCSPHAQGLLTPPVRSGGDLSPWDTIELQPQGGEQIAGQSTENRRQSESIEERQSPTAGGHPLGDRRLGSRSRGRGSGGDRSPLPEGAVRILREIGTDPSWHGIERLIGWAVKAAGPSRTEAVVSALRETHGSWCTGEIEQPCAYLRKLLAERLGLRTRPADYRQRIRETASSAPSRPPTLSADQGENRSPAYDHQRQNKGDKPTPQETGPLPMGELVRRYAPRPESGDHAENRREAPPLPDWIRETQARWSHRPPAQAQSDPQEPCEALCAAIG